MSADSAGCQRTGLDASGQCWMMVEHWTVSNEPGQTSRVCLTSVFTEIHPVGM